MNKKNNLPTVESLRYKVQESNDFLGDDYIFQEELVENALRFVELFPYFREYLSGIGFDDYELSYSIFSQLSIYIREKHLDINYNMIGDSQEYKAILSGINDMILQGSDDVKTLAIIGFIEGISQSIDGDLHMSNLREALIFPELRSGLDEVNKFRMRKGE